jgi:hypothetical protein
MPAQACFVRSLCVRSAKVVVVLALTVLTFFLAACPEQNLASLAPCTHAVGRASVNAAPTFQVDLLFVVDDSQSMTEEQTNLGAQLPELVRVLTSGRLDDEHKFQPVDLHVGVVSTDMGGYRDPNCKHSKDGLLLGAVTCGSLSASAPNYLSFEPGQEGAAIAPCAVDLGTMGCGIEQQLEAALKALSGREEDVDFAHGHGHGDRENEGFLRKDSLIVVLTVTDEDDCSAPSLDFLYEQPDDREVACGFRSDKLHPVSRYVEGLKALRSEQPDHVLFAAITGVPPELVADPKAIDYDAILADPRMQLRKDDGNPVQLVAACSEEGVGVARPARRLVQVAQAFGQNGLVQSICKRDYRGALSALLTRIVELVGPACVARELFPDASGRVECRVIETMPFGQPCAGKPGRSELPGHDGTSRCEIAQVPVLDGKVSEGDGWFYDAADSEKRCPHGKAHIGFTTGGRASPGASLALECLEPVVTAADVSRNEAAIGLGCTDDRACAAHVDPERDDLVLLCDADTRTCRQGCASDAECQAPEVCDLGQDRGVCANPTCP